MKNYKKKRYTKNNSNQYENNEDYIILKSNEP